jgi:hypothetical protein
MNRERLKKIYLDVHYGSALGYERRNKGRKKETQATWPKCGKAQILIWKMELYLEIWGPKIPK